MKVILLKLTVESCCLPRKTFHDTNRENFLRKKFATFLTSSSTKLRRKKKGEEERGLRKVDFWGENEFSFCRCGNYLRDLRRLWGKYAILDLRGKLPLPFDDLLILQGARGEMILFCTLWTTFQVFFDLGYDNASGEARTKFSLR